MTGYARGEADFAAAERFRRDAKDYSVPLHVDCSIEYELPDCAKPPQGVKIEPLLMIHPAHFRRLESLRRVPFVNNLPRETTPASNGASPVPGSGRRSTARRCCRPPPPPAAPLAPKRRHHPYHHLPLPLPAPLVERFDARALQPLPIFL